jgi:hypothetical protein
MRKFIRCVFPAFAWGIISGFPYLEGLQASGGDFCFFDVFRYLGAGNYELYFDYVVKLFIQIFYQFLFVMLFGTLIYEKFCSAGIYYILRCVNKSRWLLLQTAGLLGYAVLYLMVFVTTVAVFAKLGCHMMIRAVDMDLFVYYFILNVLWLFLLAFAMNLLAIVWGSQIGFLFVAGTEIFLSVVPLLWQGWVFLPGGAAAQINPFLRLSLTWHSSPDPRVDALIHYTNPAMNLNHSVVFFLVLSILLVVSGLVLVNRHDWFRSMEEGGSK